jgi:hypothetical protein
MPLPRPVPFVSQAYDPTGCWWACARMLRLYYGGGYASPQQLPELENEDGTHQRLGGDAYNKFMRNEGLSFLHKDVPTSTAKDIDLALTALGPIMVSWGGGQHVSLVVAVLGLSGMLVRDPQLNQWARYQKELVLASDGVTKKDGWPTGWWRVWDGSTWYYYLGNDSIAMSSKTAPSSPGPPAKPHNTGRWVFTDPSTLAITWRQAAGTTKPCVETFWNASRECERMNANSNLYSPLVATRFGK